MYQSGLFKKRKAAGSIIGGAFLVLIILAGYEFYMLNNRAQNEYQLTLNEMRNFDIDKEQEDLKITHIEKFGDIDLNDEDDTVTLSGGGTIRLHVRNDGPQLVSLEYVGLLIGGEEPGPDTDSYQPADVQISPSTVEQVDIIFTNEFHSHTILQLQVVTYRGNVFPVEYPQSQEDYPYYTILEGAISKVIGRVVPEYDSFWWSKRDLSQIDSFDWENSWAVEYDKDVWYIFKINVVHYGTDTLILGNNTALYFNDLMGPDDVQYYIVDYDEDTGQISQHTGVTLPFFDPDDPEIVTLYFATSVEGADPTSVSDNAKCPFKQDRKYQIVLGVYENVPDYSQAFSLIAIEVT
jgi:hypothetical protein